MSEIQTSDSPPTNAVHIGKAEGKANPCVPERAGVEEQVQEDQITTPTGSKGQHMRLTENIVVQDYSRGISKLNNNHPESHVDEAVTETEGQVELGGSTSTINDFNQEQERDEDSSSPNSTPPPRADEIDRWQYHVSLEEWGKRLHEAAQAVFPNVTDSRYQNVYVLMVKWKDEDPRLPVSYDIPMLKTIFEETYGFETEL